MKVKQDEYCPKVVTLNLPEDTHDCPRGRDIGCCLCKIRTGGDEIKGHVGFLAPLNAAFQVDVRLEGVIRTWTSSSCDAGTVYSAVQVMEYRFLEQLHTVDYHPDEGYAADPRHPIRYLPFRFIIPSQLMPNEFVKHRLSLDIYPSTRGGAAHVNLQTGKLYMQPLITYMLSASIVGRDGSLSSHDPCEREVLVMPTSELPPPIAPELYEQYYERGISMSLREGIMRRKRGLLKVYADEPLPINLRGKITKVGSRALVSTKITLRLEYWPAAGEKDTPPEWPLMVQSRLQKRAICSTRFLQLEPVHEELRSASLHVRLIKYVAEMRIYSSLAWRRQYSAANTPNDARNPWTAELSVVVVADSKLAPSFFAPTATVRYAVALKIGALGYNSAQQVLEVPVQIVRCPVEQVAPSTSTADWPMPRVSFESFDSGSDALSDILGEDPPSYRSK